MFLCWVPSEKGTFPWPQKFTTNKKIHKGASQTKGIQGIQLECIVHLQWKQSNHVDSLNFVNLT